ncbi:MAG: 50S ribosomal protein L4 [Candidatus Micrarchaeota archaeon]|nr:50S ribosomal protein L4 [Candidatus Micrarchaeota archaeon]
MTDVDVLSIDGRKSGSVALPEVFSEAVRPELILRAVNAENSRKLQPQGHNPLAGMDNTAMYYGSMHSYRTGRHMGIAIRPRQKLGGGQQGAVRVIPSSVKGRRAHPHKIEKILVENINRREYSKAIASAVAATVPETKRPIIVSNEIESIKRTKDMVTLIRNLKLDSKIDNVDKRIRKGLRRSSKRRSYTKTLLVVVGKDGSAIKSARNIAGVDACAVGKLSAGLLAPGGRPGRSVIWSESAIGALQSAVSKIRIGE